jgi:hypothetical protein
MSGAENALKFFQLFGKACCEGLIVDIKENLNGSRSLEKPPQTTKVSASFPICGNYKGR